jgi:hypothetical protein
MKSFRITVTQIFYMQCIREIRIYIHILSGVLNIKKKFAGWKTCTQIYMMSISRLCLPPEIVNVTRCVSDFQEVWVLLLYALR